MCRTIFSLLVGLLIFSTAAHADELDTLLQELHSKSFSIKANVVDKLGELDDPQVINILQHMLEGELYYTKKDNVTVFAIKEKSLYSLFNARTQEPMGQVKKREIKKISVNNSLRRQLRATIANLSLFNKDPQKRLQAAEELLKNFDPEQEENIRKALEKETNSDVRDVLQSIKATIDLNSNEKSTRLAAIEYLGESLSQETINQLNGLMAKDSNGEFLEKDKEIRQAAEKAIARIESKRVWYGQVENLFFGISLGSVLLLAAIGLAITFGVMGVINMAHGEMMMLGAYTTYVIQQAFPGLLEVSLIIAIPAAFIIAGLFGIAIERTVIRHLYGRPLETLLATFGISLILQQLVRSVFSPLNRAVSTPEWMSGSWQINDALSITYSRVYIVIFSLLVLAGLMLFMKRTFFGLQMRAVTQNRPMASSMGINTGWVDAMTFGLGSGIAGIAGVALSQLTNVGPNLGQAYIVDSFMVVVFGGVGNLWGTLVGAMSLGIINKFMEPFTGSVLAKILVLIFIILFIQKRPRGLFALKGRSVED